MPGYGRTTGDQERVQTQVLQKSRYSKAAGPLR